MLKYDFVVLSKQVCICFFFVHNETFPWPLYAIWKLQTAFDDNNNGYCESVIDFMFVFNTSRVTQIFDRAIIGGNSRQPYEKRPQPLLRVNRLSMVSMIRHVFTLAVEACVPHKTKV